MTKLNVQSIFHSIDGEINGFLGAGQFSTFIRLKGCNLQCAYCDTEYSQEFQPYNWMTIQEIINEVRFPKITITGGEPLEQQKGLEALIIQLLFSKGIEYTISVETNGSMVPSLFWTRVRYIVDFKLHSSGMSDKMNPAAFDSLREEDVIKFVVSDWDDYDQMVELVQSNPQWKAKTAVSPAIQIIHPTVESEEEYVGILPAVDLEWPRKLLDRTMQDGYVNSFSLQNHKIMWPGTTEEK